jgi:tetratricopeptide (TPR) repeat protein
MKRLMQAGAIALLLATTPWAVQAQGRPLPGDASQSVKQASQLLDQVRGSNLDHWWRANAIARMARTLARMGDTESARTLGRDTLLVLREENKDAPPPPALSESATFAILSQAYADLRDPVTATEAANASLKAMSADPAIRAATLPLIALAMAEAGNRAPAGGIALEGLRSAASLPPGRDQLSALAAIAQVQAKLGDRDAALGTAMAAKESLPANASAADRAIGLAQIARAYAAAGDSTTARTLARDAIRTYDQSVNDTSVSMGQRVAGLALIAIAQAEAGDKNSARQILGIAKQTMAGINGQYEKLISLLTLADAAMLIER